VSAAALAWDGGGEARVVALDGEAIVLRSTRPHAPGSRPSGTLTGGARLRVKTHRSKRDEAPSDGMEFTIDGRVLDLTRDVRALLVEALATPSITPG
jgi:hypothetical protein